MTDAAHHSGKKALYGTKGGIGSALSNWRTRIVGRHVHGRVLVDLACGDNRLVRALGFGTGVDITPYPNVDLVHPDFTNLPFAAGSVDTVTILAALNYFENPIGVLRDIRRVLKDDGILIVTQLRRRISRMWHMLRDRGLPREAYSEQELTALLVAAGLQIRKKHTFMFGLNVLYIIEKSKSPGR